MRGRVYQPAGKIARPVTAIRFRVKLLDNGDARFVWPDGHLFPEAPPTPGWAGNAQEPSYTHLAAAGITIDGDTATPDWYGERLDLPWTIQVLRPPAPSVTVGRGVPAGTPSEGPPGPVLDAGPLCGNPLRARAEGSSSESVGH